MRIHFVTFLLLLLLLRFLLGGLLAAALGLRAQFRGSGISRALLTSRQRATLFTRTIRLHIVAHGRKYYD